MNKWIIGKINQSYVHIFQINHFYSVQNFTKKSSLVEQKCLSLVMHFSR